MYMKNNFNKEVDDIQQMFRTLVFKGKRNVCYKCFIIYMHHFYMIHV